MRAHAIVHAVAAGGRTHATRLRSEAPLLARASAAADGALVVQFVGGAAGPLGGDALRTEVHVGAGAVLRARSVAASLAQPSPAGGTSAAHVAVVAENGASLDWRPEPLISVAGSAHAIDTRIDVRGAAELIWLDEVVLGRHREPSGRLRSRLRVTIDGSAVVDHEILGGDGPLAGPGANGPFRVVASAVVISGDAQASPPPIVTDHCRAAALSVGQGVTLLSGLATTRDELTAAFALLGLPPRPRSADRRIPAPADRAGG